MNSIIHEFRDFWTILKDHPFRRMMSDLKIRFWHRQLQRGPEYGRPLVSIKAEGHLDWGLTELGVAEAWRVTKGHGAKLAILDTGIAMNHPDLRNKIVAAVDFTNERTPTDGNGHGTHCAGIASADGVIEGVAPECSLYIGKVMNSAGSGDFEWITQGINWAVDQKVHVISLSLGCPVPYGRMYDAVKRAYQAGIIVVCAAGNDGEEGDQDTIGYPARYDEVISIGSIDSNFQRSYFSSEGQELDFMAPGGQVYSCWPPDKYSVLSGTSMATPFAAGFVSLIVAKHVASGSMIPNKDQLLEQLKKMVKGNPSPWNTKTGWGILDATKIPTLG